MSLSLNIYILILNMVTDLLIAFSPWAYSLLPAMLTLPALAAASVLNCLKIGDCPHVGVEMIIVCMS